MGEVNIDINDVLLENDILETIKRYNKLMMDGIIGPNCTDPNICHADCCSIFIDVPKRLAKEIIHQGYGDENDFIRGDTFSFQLRLDDKTSKCVFIDKKINGCKLHQTGLKPPQCWIYPTNFDNFENNNIECKKTEGWKIIAPEKVKKAETLLKLYSGWSQAEYVEEMKKINQRLKNKLDGKSLEERLQEIKPSEFAGFRDSWNYFTILKAEGLSLQTKKYCRRFNPKCSLLPNQYFECKNICQNVAYKLTEFFNNALDFFLNKFGSPDKGVYSLIKLSDFF